MDSCVYAIFDGFGKLQSIFVLIYKAVIFAGYTESLSDYSSRMLIRLYKSISQRFLVL